MSNETESNSSASTANAFTLGSPIKGQLSTSADVDYYKFTAASSGSVSITLNTPTNSSYNDYFNFTLYDSSNNALGQYSTGKDLTASLGISAAGTYYVKVAADGYSHDAGEYNLTASLAAGSAAGFESESNSSASTANALTLGSPIKGQLSTSADVDYYKFTAASSGSVSITLNTPTNSSYNDYFNFTLYDSSNNALGQYSTGKDLTASLGISAAGTYYVKVAADGYSHDAGEYNLTASLAAGSAAGFESESNSSASTANALTLGSPIKGQLSTSADVDYYKFTAASSGSVSITLNTPTNSSYNDYFNFTLCNWSGE